MLAGFRQGHPSFHSLEGQCRQESIYIIAPTIPTENGQGEHVLNVVPLRL